jgi:hypothetical protein
LLKETLALPSSNMKLEDTTSDAINSTELNAISEESSFLHSLPLSTSISKASPPPNQKCYLNNRTPIYLPKQNAFVKVEG